MTDTPQWALPEKSIVAVAAYKGGVGKSTLSYELAWLLEAVLVDLDWDWGGVTRSWGYRHETRVMAPLLDAFESGRPPRPLAGKLKPDLVPSHPDLVANQPPADQMAVQLEKWTSVWDRPVVVDTHPGGNELTYGAMAAAHLTLVPTLLEEKPLEALEGMLNELADYPLLVVPSRVPTSPPALQLRRLEQIVQRHQVPVAPPVYACKGIPRRTRRMAVTAREPAPAAYTQFASEVHALTDQVVRHVGH